MYDIVLGSYTFYRFSTDNLLGLGLDGNEVCCQNFPLPTLGPRLRSLALEIHQGRGFFVLRGFNPDDYDTEDNLLLFLGISSYIGEKRGQQDGEGSMIGKPQPTPFTDVV